MKCFYQYLVYDQHGKFGSGGYSRNAKHKPLPRVVEGHCQIEAFKPTGSITLAYKGWATGDDACKTAITKHKVNILSEDGQTRIDYPDIVPAWWRDKLAVTCKFAELNHE